MTKKSQAAKKNKKKQQRQKRAQQTQPGAQPSTSGEGAPQLLQVATDNVINEMDIEQENGM